MNTLLIKLLANVGTDAAVIDSMQNAANTALEASSNASTYTEDGGAAPFLVSFCILLLLTILGALARD